MCRCIYSLPKAIFFLHLGDPIIGLIGEDEFMLNGFIHIVSKRIPKGIRSTTACHTVM